MHILLSIGAAPGLPTGYGGQGLFLVQAALAAGHTVTCLCWNFFLGTNKRALPPRAVPTPEFVAANKSMAVVLSELPTDEDRAAWRRRVTWMYNLYGEHPPREIRKADLNAAIAVTGADLFLALQDVFMYGGGPLACPSMLWVPPHFLPAEQRLVLALADFDVLVAISDYGAALMHQLFGTHQGPLRKPLVLQDMPPLPAPATPEAAQAAAAAALPPSTKHIETIAHGVECATTFVPLPHAADASSRGTALWREERAAVRRQLKWPTEVARGAAPRTAGGGGAGVDITAPHITPPLDWDGDVHITLMVAANAERSGRKAFDAQLEAWVTFARARDAAGYPPDATYLVVHATVVGAYDVGRLLETLGEFPQRGLYHDWTSGDGRGNTRIAAADGVLYGPRFRVTPPASGLLLNGKGGGSSNAVMAAMYQASDALLAATTSEGCGVPILEAQLCGCAVVTNATTAMPEQTLLGISAQPGQYIARDDFNSGWLLPSAPAVTAALTTLAARTPAVRAAAVAAALPRLRARYSATGVVAAWTDLWSRMERDVVRPWRAAMGGADAVQQDRDDADSGSTDLVAWLAAPPRRIVVVPPRAILQAATAQATTASATAAEEAATLASLAAQRGLVSARLEYVAAARATLAAAMPRPLPLRPAAPATDAMAAAAAKTTATAVASKSGTAATGKKARRRR